MSEQTGEIRQPTAFSAASSELTATQPDQDTSATAPATHVHAAGPAPYGLQGELTRAILQTDSFIDKNTEELVRASAEQLGVDLDAALCLVHTGILRLVATERRRDRKAAQQQPTSGTNRNTVAGDASQVANWLTAERQTHIRRKHPLIVRTAARTVMRLVNEQRVDPQGNPLNTPAGRALKMTPVRKIITVNNETTNITVRYLRKIGLHALLPPSQQAGIWHSPVPVDTQAFLRTYPLATLPQPGEHNRQSLRTLTGASYDRIDRIIRELSPSAYPEIRSVKKGPSYDEVLFYGTADVKRIQEALPSLMPKTAGEYTVKELFAELGSTTIGGHALRQANPTLLLRKGRKGSEDCVDEAGRAAVKEAFIYLTTTLPGEADIEGLMDLTGLSRRGLEVSYITDEHRRASRPLYALGQKARRIFPPHVVEEICTAAAAGRPLQVAPSRRSSTKSTKPRENAAPLSGSQDDQATGADPETASTQTSPRRVPARTIERIAQILGVEPWQVNKINNQLPNTHGMALVEVNGAAKTVIGPHRAATIGVHVVSERLHRTPSTQLTIPQISLVSGVHSETVQTVITQNTIRRASTEGPETYNGNELHRLLGKLGVELGTY